MLELSLSPIRITVPKGAPNGALLGSAKAAMIQDIRFACTGTDNTREVRVWAPTDVTTGVSDIYATNLAGIGFRIVTRGGSFAGVDDGPRNAAYKVALPEHADRLTGFAVNVDFVKTGDGQGGVLAPGKLASVIVGGTTLVDVMVPDGGIAFAPALCAPVTVGGEVSAGVSNLGSFSQEAVVIQTGCASSNVNVAIGLSTGYVYGAPSALVEAPPPKPAHALLEARKGAVIVATNRNGQRAVLNGDAQASAGQTDSTQRASADDPWFARKPNAPSRDKDKDKEN